MKLKYKIYKIKVHFKIEKSLSWIQALYFDINELADIILRLLSISKMIECCITLLLKHIYNNN